MKKIIITCTGLCFLFTAYKNLPSPLSSGAPAASTGAPGEKQCAVSGCHSDFPLNNGSAQIFFSIGNGEINYEPGKTYDGKIEISDAAKERFGFEVVALNAENKNAGTILLTEPARTQIIPGFENLSDRRYITYTYEGTSAVSSGFGKWDFRWVAPQVNEGNVTFYLAAISANNDGTDMGDYCYTRILTLSAPGQIPAAWTIAPSAGSGVFILQVPAFSQKLMVYNLSGKKVFETINPEAGIQNLELTAVSEGVYLVSLVQNEKTETKKIVITK